MNRVVQSVLGTLAVLVGLVVALLPAWRTGEVTAPVATLALGLVAVGAHFVSRSLLSELIKHVLEFVRAWRKPQ